MSEEKAVQLNEALVHIIPEGLPEVVKLLLDNGANANSEDGKYTALMLAAGNIKRDNNDIVEMLLKNGANINEKEREGWTALMFAVRNGNERCAQLLLDNSADVNLQKKDGYTALMLAIVSRHYDLIRLLLKASADTNLKSNDGTALDITLMTEHSMMMSDGKNEYVVQMLLDHRATIPSPSESGMTFLMKMIYTGFVEVAEYLLTVGADPKESDKAGRTAATFAEFKGLTELAQRLSA